MSSGQQKNHKAYIKTGTKTHSKGKKSTVTLPEKDLMADILERLLKIFKYMKKTKEI